MKQLVCDPTNSGKEITVTWNVTPEVTILHSVSHSKSILQADPEVKGRLDFPLAMDIQPFSYVLVKMQVQLFPILNIFVPHVGHTP